MRFHQAPWITTIAAAIVSIAATAHTAVVATLVQRPSGKHQSLTLLREFDSVVACGLGGNNYLLYDSARHQYYLVNTVRRLYARFDAADTHPPVKRIPPPRELPTVADSLNALSSLVEQRSIGKREALQKPQVKVVHEGTRSLPEQFAPLFRRNIVRASCLLPVANFPGTVVMLSRLPGTRLDIDITTTNAAPAWRNFQAFRLVDAAVMEGTTLKTGTR